MENDLRYEIIAHIGVIKENKDKTTKLELNRIRWDGRHPVYDLRIWIKENDEYRPTGKGIRMYYEDILMLSKVLVDL